MLKMRLPFLWASICLLFAIAASGATGWIQQTSHTTARLGSVCFVNDSVGYVTGDSGVVLKTRDGGNTWTRLYLGSYAGIMGIHAVDSTHVYLTDYVGAKVWKTENGGGLWSSIAPAKDSMSAMGLWFMNTQRGFFGFGKYSTYSNSRILRTVNGGTSWDTVLSTPQWISYLHFPDPGHGFATGSAKTIFKTADSGATWTPLTPYPDTIFYSGVFFLNKDTGYVGGGRVDSGIRYQVLKVFRTTNGGANWTTASSSVVPIKLFFVNDSTGYLIGGDSMVLNSKSQMTNIRLMKTQNRGATWQNIDLGTTVNLNGFYFPSAKVGYVVGDLGTIFKYQGPSAVKNSSVLSATIGTSLISVSMESHKLHINYSLAAEGIRQIGFAMYDINGRCVWTGKTVDHALGSHAATFTFTRRCTAGIYLFSMSTTDAALEKHTSIKRFVVRE